MDQSLSGDLLFGMKPMLIIRFRLIFEISSELKKIINSVLNLYICISKSMYRHEIYNKQSSRVKQQAYNK